MYMDYTKFSQVTNQVAEVFSAWDESMKDFTNVAREGVLKISICAHSQ